MTSKRPSSSVWANCMASQTSRARFPRAPHGGQALAPPITAPGLGEYLCDRDAGRRAVARIEDMQNMRLYGAKIPGAHKP